MRWPWERRTTEPAGGEQVATRRTAPARPAPSPSGWAFHAPLQRTIAPMTPVHEGTAAGWTATGRDIGLTGRMSHLVSASSWSGVVDGDGGGLATVARASSTGLPAAGTSTVATGGTAGGPLTRATAAPGLPVVHFAPSPGPLAPPPPAGSTPVQRVADGAGLDAAGQPPVAWTNPDLQPDDGTVVEIPLSPGRPLDPPPVQRSTGGSPAPVAGDGARGAGPTVQRSVPRRLGLGAPLSTVPAPAARQPAPGVEPESPAPPDVRSGSPDGAAAPTAEAGAASSGDGAASPGAGAAVDAPHPLRAQRAVEPPTAASTASGDGAAGPAEATGAVPESPPPPAAQPGSDGGPPAHDVGTIGAPGSTAGGPPAGGDGGRTPELPSTSAAAPTHGGALPSPMVSRSAELPVNRAGGPRTDGHAGPPPSA